MKGRGKYAKSGCFVRWRRADLNRSARQSEWKCKAFYVIEEVNRKKKSL